MTFPGDRGSPKGHEEPPPRAPVHPELAKMLDLRFFLDHGFVRKQCPSCQEPFWTRDAVRTLCGDSTCEEYQFLGDPLTDKPLSLPAMREAFLSYWEGLGHGRVQRNPVVARWRDDLYLNIASIANYQPHVTSGDVPPPANPLVVSQPCIRLNDLSNIGRSGRHFACFEMMGHHAFNSQEWGEHYWTEECVANGHRFLTDALGLDGDRITYKESTWSGGGNAGPCLEVFAGGLEVATLVFMCLEQVEPEDLGEAQAFEIKGDLYRMMDLRIIDTGWGLERLAWASTGTPTAYDTVFPDTIAYIKELATVPIADDERSRRLVEMHARVQGVLNLDIGTSLSRLREEVVARMAEHGITTSAKELEAVMDPIEAMYALADHLRCLSFMVGDGIVPSNVKAGYLMRLVFRRALRFKQRLGIDEGLDALLAWNLERMLPDFPEFEEAIPRAGEIARLETGRADESRERGIRLVERTLAKKKKLDTDDLVELYDTHGLGPNLVAEVAREKGVQVDVPDTFDAIVAERHSKEKKAKPRRIVPPEVPPTRRIFYEEGGDQMEFEAEVTWVGDVTAEFPQLARHTSDGKIAGHVIGVVLDASCFFHETGGQPGDQGTLVRGKDAVTVRATIKDGDHPVHLIEGRLTVGDTVHGIVDRQRRMDHTRSHTATHIMNQAVRRVLGPHSFQAGTQKHTDCARVDMSHYRRPTREELDRIEELANAVVMEGRPVTPEWHTRDEAEKRWGLQLLQGGIPKGRDVRVVRIGPASTPVSGIATDEDFDVEYCGGTHCTTTGQVGPIKLFRTERIQDGVERFEYSAGTYAVARWQAPEAVLRKAAAAMDVAPAEVADAAARFFDEWKERGKLLEELQRRIAELAVGSGEQVGDLTLHVRGDLPASAMQKVAEGLLKQEKTVVLFGAAEAGKVRLLFARSSDVDLHMGKILGQAAPLVDGRGGGRPDFAQGGGTKVDGLAAALAKAKELATN